MLHGRFHCFGAGIAKDNTVVPLCPTRQLPRSVAPRICGPIPVRGSAFDPRGASASRYNRGMRVPEQQRSVAADEVKHPNLAALLVMVVKKVAFTAVINDIESDRPE